jgi:hypothetical protein
MTEMTPEERERIVLKIKKCLELGKSSEPHEAAAALRQAQKLMDKHSVDLDEVAGIYITSELVITPEPPKKKIPLYMQMITTICMKAFGVNGMYERRYTDKGLRHCVRYFGDGNAPMLAKYAHEVMFAQMMRAWNDYRRGGYEFQLGDRQSFWCGWLAQVESKVVRFAKPEGLNERINDKMTEYNNGEELQPAKQSTQELNNRMMVEGAIRGADFSIHRPMSGRTETPGPKLLK